ncbi:(d)CMP kinase [Geofilum rubicundum]|uniref:Cytidylate kinase n=1 Tax=Geofilum rubicundum JCM 15548 TaxID=1236989 RepID=A0A0E9LUS1_9BACT|nr:(d)CMP kinase [Geofilum rubicundum]GAO28994.1 cytidylate kinase [Geofilum rubicundum JCM 15548]
MSKNIQNIIIAIDGHSSCGKSTVAKDLAKKFDLTYIDTGAMYRAVTLFARQKGLISDGQVHTDALQNQIGNIHVELRKNPTSKQVETFLNGTNVEAQIRTLEISKHVSAISALAFVRKRMVELQQEMGKAGGVVLDGRDIGTVVFPDAHLKIFMTASPEIRAQRRFDEMQEKGEAVTFKEILDNVVLRDHLDSTRKESPLKQAEDAWVLDNSHLSRQDQLDWILDRLQKNGWL